MPHPRRASSARVARRRDRRYQTYYLSCFVVDDYCSWLRAAYSHTSSGADMFRQEDQPWAAIIIWREPERLSSQLTFCIVTLNIAQEVNTTWGSLKCIFLGFKNQITVYLVKNFFYHVLSYTKPFKPGAFFTLEVIKFTPFLFPVDARQQKFRLLCFLGWFSWNLGPPGW